MIPLKNNPILKPYQVEILRLFFASDTGKKFYLTGGTALSAFYLAHRDSKDFDFFTQDEIDFTDVNVLLVELADKMGASISTKVSSKSYTEKYLSSEKDGWVQRLDFVKEIPGHFGAFQLDEGIIYDALENITVNKIIAIFGRLEPKDYVDFYFIAKTKKLDFDDLFKKARTKDLGMDEFYFANMILAAQDMEMFPKIFLPFDVADFRKFYKDLSRNLLLKIRPKK